MAMESAGNDILSFPYQVERAVRLDTFIQQWFALNKPSLAVTRSQIKRWIDEGHVSVDGKKVHKAGAVLQHEGTIAVIFRAQAAHALEAYDFDLHVIFEDQFFAVINKPAGLTMHPGAGNKTATLLNALLHRYGDQFAQGGANADRPGIVHRLDKDTTGLVVVAKDPATHHALSSQFAAKEAKRTYLALALSTPRKTRGVDRDDSGTITARIGRHRSDRTLMCVIQSGGREAVTHWRVRERFSHASLLELSLDTGRTHQIRVHLEHIASPVIGDKAYGDFSALPKELSLAAEKFGRQALHAAKLEFTHPASGKHVVFQAEPPEDMERLIELFRGYGKQK